MARTNGQRNPPWTREETILALHLLLDSGMTTLSDAHPKVVALSAFLRCLPANRLKAESPSFRNPAGVSFKLSNLQSVATGRGFTNGSTIDKLVWTQFENRRQKLKEAAQLIAAYGPTDAELREDDAGDDDEFLEGSTVTRVHKRLERKAGLRKAVLKKRLLIGRLHCDACGVGNPTDRSDFESSIFEVHHLLPLSLTGNTRTLVKDTALLCANCHRITHRLIKNAGRWVDINDVRSTLFGLELSARER